MIGRPEVDPRTGEPTRGAAMLHILKHGSAERQSRTAALFGVVAGPTDALWSLHVDIARQVLAKGGVSADELSEWLAVARQRVEGGA